ncbi:MAG: hypothetical protein J6Y39_05715 [Bacteroidaceae bacterium]|nr:hypothetical protein [Bacteroidaceae bacterium]
MINLRKKDFKKLLIPVLLIVALIIVGVRLLDSEREIIFRMQELSLFLPTRLFFTSSMIYPGGVLTWTAAWATQFFYHPTLGITLMLICWAAIMGLTCYLFRLRGIWQGLSLLIPLALLACLVQTGYWLYYMKLQGHVWVPTLGVLFSLILAIPYRLISNQWARLGWMAAVGSLGYPLMGAWSFLAIGIMGLLGIEIDKWKLAICLLLIIAVPPIMQQWFYGQVQHNTVYIAAMPSFQYGDDNIREYHYSYYAIPLIFIIIALASNFGERLEQKKFLPITIVILFTVIGIWGVNKRWYRDTNFHKEVAMMNAIEQLDWERVLRIMLSQDMGEPMPPTRVMVMMKNLALFRLGRAGDEMFRYPEGAEQQHAPWTVRMTQVGGKMLYYHYGKAGFCYRWCMEDGVEFGWSVDVLKYMSKTSLISHDWEVARKYLNLLKKTRYHKEWAERYEAFIEHPELMEADEEMKIIVPMSQFPDRLDGDNTLIELYLLKTFANGTGTDVYYQEMTLLCSLIMKDIDLFWPRFRQWLNMHQKDENFRVPRYYQEAAYLYIMLEPQRPSELWPGETNAQALSKIPFDETVKQSYQNFMNFNTQCGSMSEDQKAVAFHPQFGDTFYYFYFLVRNQKTN